MISFLKRLLMGDDASLFGDLAAGDWSPVPAYATARANSIVDWLQEAPREKLRRRLKTWRSSVMDHLSPEERRIVAEQRNRRKKREVSPKAALQLASMAPEPMPAPASQGASAQPEDWVEVLKKYGEHLTDAELEIIRSQLKN